MERESFKEYSEAAILGRKKELDEIILRGALYFYQWGASFLQNRAAEGIYGKSNYIYVDINL